LVVSRRHIDGIILGWRVEEAALERVKHTQVSGGFEPEVMLLEIKIGATRKRCYRSGDCADDKCERCDEDLGSETALGIPKSSSQAGATQCGAADDGGKCVAA
jgi:hypothetical protein